MSTTDSIIHVAQKDGMIQEFGHFHPEILKILRHVLSDSELPVKPMLIMDIRISQEVKCWPLYIHDPLPRWTYGNVVLIGDAAHPVSQPVPCSQ